MAVVLTAFTGQFKRVPYIKPPDLQRMQTAIPRALLAFTLSASIPAKPVNDQQNVQVAVQLPTTFAYRMVSAICTIKQDVADDWDTAGSLRVTNGMRGQAATGQSNEHAIGSQLGSAFATSAPERYYRLDPQPTYIIQSIAVNAAPVVDFRFTNIAAAVGAAGNILFFCQLYEYDIEQVQRFPPLVPVLTYAIA